MNYKELRLQKGLSQAKAARVVGVTIGTWINWEYGVGSPNEENAKKLQKIVDMPEKKDIEN